MPTNVDFKYAAAETRYSVAQTDEEKLVALEEMIKTMPKHKSAESLRKNIRTRYKKLKTKVESGKKRKKSASRKQGIKKEEMQAVIIGLTNSGKSSLLDCLTNANPKIASYKYTTNQPQIGTLNYEDVKIQIIDLPALENELCDQGIINTADALLITIIQTENLKKIEPFLTKSTKNRIIILNKIDSLGLKEKRKVEATLKSKKYQFILFSTKTKENLDLLKEKIFQSFGKIRVYTKEPGKPLDKEPIILPAGSTVKEVAEKILHGFSRNIKETRITGPSSKFPNQKTGLKHVLKDKDIIEFYVK